jgi:hypothetical protein
MKCEARDGFDAVAVCVSKPSTVGQHLRKTMTFTHKLYQHISDALPGITTRSFSRYCGKSEGYYGSICAQQLPISTNSLIYLAEMLEQLIAIKHYDQPRTSDKLRRTQQIIADEIAQRTQNFVVENLPVRKMIIKAVASAAYSRDHQYHMPAIVFG